MTGEDVRHKDFLRRHFRDTLRCLPAGRRRDCAGAVARRLSRLPVFAQAPAVAVYLTRPGELDTAPLIALCRRLGKIVLAPVVDPSTKTLRFAVWPVRGPRVRNVHGILEPGGPRRPERPLGPRDLLVVPGRAFTPAGDRLGAGGGYYDRFLARGRARSVGLAFDEQIVLRLPRRPHDRRVGLVVSPNRIYTA